MKLIAASPSIQRSTAPSTPKNNEAWDEIEVDRVHLRNNLRLYIKEASVVLGQHEDQAPPWIKHRLNLRRGVAAAIHTRRRPASTLPDARSRSSRSDSAI